MKRKDVENLYSELLAPFLEQYGFQEKRNELSFVRNNELGFDRIRFGVTYYEGIDKSDVFFEFQKRHNNASEIVDAWMGPYEYIQHVRPTTNVHIATLLNMQDIKSYNNMVYSKGDIIKDIEVFKSIYFKRAEILFEEFSDLSKVMDKYHKNIGTALNYCGPFNWCEDYMAICHILGDHEKLKLMPNEILNYFEKALPTNGDADKEEFRKRRGDELRSFANHLLNLE